MNFLSTKVSFTQNLKEIISFILVLGLFFYVWNDFLLGNSSLPQKQSETFLQALSNKDLIGQEEILDTNFSYLISKRESWQFFQNILSSIQTSYNIEPLKGLSVFIFSLIFLGGVVSFFIGKKLFKDFYAALLLFLFVILGPPTLYAVSQNIVALIPFLCFWPLVFFFSSFFSGKISFLFIIIPALLMGFILNSTFFSFGFVILLISLILAFSLNLQNLKIKQFFSFLLIFLLFLGIALGFSGSFVSEFLMKERFKFEPFSFFDATSLKLIILPITENGIYLFSGFSFLFLGFLGLIFYWYRYFLVTIFLVIFVFLSLGIFGNLGQLYGIFLQEFIWGILFFWLFFAVKGMEMLRQKKIVGTLFATLFLFLIIFESVFWIIEKKVVKFSDSIEKTTLTRYQSEIIKGVHFYLKNSSGSRIIDDKNIIPKNIWRKSGIALGENKLVKNFSYLDSHGILIIFSDRIISPNPDHFEKIKIYKEFAWLNKKALPELYFYPEKNIKNSTNEKIKYRYENEKIDFSNEVFISQSIKSTDYKSYQKNLISELLKIKTVFRDDSTWIFSANIPEKGLLTIFQKMNPSWKISINEKFFKAFLVNENFMGIPLDRGNYKIKIEKISPLLSTGKIAFKRTFYLSLFLIIIEFFWKKRKIFKKIKIKKSIK